MSRADPRIVFAASFTRMTGDGEQLTVNFNAEDQGELRKRLALASEVINAHVKKHNDKVLDISAEVREKAERAKADIERRERQRLASAGLIPQALVGDPPKEANGADPAGTPDLRADS